MASNSPGQVEYGKAKAFYDKEDYGNALKHLSKSEELARREGDLGTLAVTHICKGVCLFRFSEFDLALKAFKHALPLAIEAESEASRTVFLLYRYLINSCLEKRDRMQARHYAERRVLWAEKHAKKDEMSESLFSCAEILAEYCDQRMRALDMYERALPLFDEDDEKRYNCVFRMGCVCTGLEVWENVFVFLFCFVYSVL
jgi:tetratricopeptide (TPR) repeat protein